ncbi:Chaperone protein HtpG [Candidatus Entotheonellaceae bacterium PAL068K]
MEGKAETFQLQAETRQILELMIHSLYTNKEIFLRELISNASDALDRLRFEALTQPDLLADDDTLAIRLEPDKQAKTLTIHDSGIGMSREEVITNIGTIAKSGTRELLERIRQEGKTDDTLAELIGRFGVGFYSAFMVADKVTLVTRRAGEATATQWESVGDGHYTLSAVHKPSRGTSITLYLKPADPEMSLEDYTETWTLSRIVKRYSDFVTYPVQCKDQREEVERDAQGRPKPDGKTTIVVEDKTLNSMKPIWTRSQSEVTDEEYVEFYKHISHDWNEPLKTMAFKAEGRFEFQGCVFIPAQAPFDLYYHAVEYGLQLYAQRVMIMEHYTDLLPRYLRFVKGVVDSADLPLNISRQRLQQDQHVTQIRQWLTKKILDTLTHLYADERETYLKFWEQFGQAVKEGVSSDYDNKDTIVPLLLFPSSHAAETLTTLKEYVERMPEEQSDIFYLTGESRHTVENSPHLEAFQAKGYEVLYLVEPVDELVVQSLTEFDGKPLKSIGKGTVALGSDEEKKQTEEALKEKAEAYGSLLELFQQKLDEHVKEVRLSNRLTASPVCLVGAEHDYSPQLERLLRQAQQNSPKQRRIMELNPTHPILIKLHERFQQDTNDPFLGTYAELLFGYGLLAEGSELQDPIRFNQLVAELMVQGL